MAVIGTWGDIVFETSDLCVRNFSGLTHSAKGRWAVHETLQCKPKAEFVGPGQNEQQLTIRLSNSLGVDPRAEFEKIGTMILQGKHAPFLLGEKVIGNGEWYAEENGTTFTYIDPRGVVQFIEMQLSMKEYF